MMIASWFYTDGSKILYIGILNSLIQNAILIPRSISFNLYEVKCLLGGHLLQYYKPYGLRLFTYSMNCNHKQ
jgi:hypothetical protein